MASSHRQSAGDLLSVCLLTLALSVSLLPSLPLLARRLGAPAPEVGLLVAAPILVFVFVPAREPWTHLPQRWRRAAPAALLAFSLLLTAYVTAPWQLLLLRMTTGIACLGLASFPQANWALAGATRPVALAGASWAVGPLVAGLAAALSGLPGPFFLAAGLAALAAALGLVRTEEGGGALATAESPDWVPLGQWPAHLAVLTLATFFPLYAADTGLAPAVTGALCTFAILVWGAAALVGQRCRPYAHSLATCGLLLAALGAAALAVAAHVVVLAAAITICGAGFGCLAAGLAAGAGGQRRPRPNLAWLASLALFPPLAGVVVLALGPESLFLLVAVGLAAAALVLAATPTGATVPVAAALGHPDSGCQPAPLSATSWGDGPAVGENLPEVPQSPRA
jgi:hypothetical protein